MESAPIGMFVATGLIFVMVLVWLGAQVFFLWKVSKLDHKPSKGTIGLWVLSVIGMFTGPCVALFSLVALLIAGAHLMRSPETDADRVGLRAVVAGSSLGLLMIVIALAGAAASGAFTG